MNRDPVSVFARIRARPGCEADVLRELQALVPPTRKEPGCIDYVLHQAADDTALFMFYENWSTMEDLDRHSVSAHLQSWRARSADLIAEPIEVRVFRKV